MKPQGRNLPKTRLEAFSDGVLAIAITLLALEIRLPQIPGESLAGLLLALGPKLLAYATSFLTCAVWWISHHQLIEEAPGVDRALLWLNCAFLLWLCLLPFATSVLGDHLGEPAAYVLYGAVCGAAGLCFFLMRSRIALRRSADFPWLRIFRAAVSPLLYLAGAATAFLSPRAALAVFALIPLYFAITTRLAPGGIPSHGENR